jgi:sec-independent protein translocase protein TatA
MGEVAMSLTPLFIQNLRPLEIIIILLVILLLFGAKKLPDLARGVGQSLRIFRAETKALTDEDEKPRSEPAAESQPEVEATSDEPEHNPVSESVGDQLKRDA